MRGPCATKLLERALVRTSARAGCPLQVTQSRSVPWHSATFAGARHELHLVGATGAALDGWLAQVEDLDLDLPGHLVAEAQVGALERQPGETRFTLAALTVATA